VGQKPLGLSVNGRAQARQDPGSHATRAKPDRLEEEALWSHVFMGQH